MRFRLWANRIESEKQNPNSDLYYGICMVKLQEMTQEPLTTL